MRSYYLTPREQRWREYWPAGWVALLAIIQFFLTATIITTETVSLVVDFYHSMIFAGYYCSLFFFITWISMCSVTCCNRHSTGCATHALIENILSIIAASVLLYFDSLFLNNPYTCLFGSTSDCTMNNTKNNTIYNSTNYNWKLAMIKTQLACASVMLATCVIYIATFIYVLIRIRRTKTTAVEAQDYPRSPPVVMNQSAWSIPQRRTFKCPHCHNLIQIP